MALKKKTKTILMWILGIIAVFFVWRKFFTDKMGGYMSVGSDNWLYYKGKKTTFQTSGGGVKLVDGYWQAVGLDGATYQYRETGFARV